jgi:alkylhydroperoxidase family enzyme
MAGLREPEAIAALNGNADRPKDAAALKFAAAVVQKRGRIDDADFNNVVAAGFTPGQVTEINAHVVLNTFTNYFNNVANTENDYPSVELPKTA